MQGGMFRKAALDKVSSPEQLDLMMQVTSPMGWLALVTIGLILAVVVAWSIVGSIPDLVDGQGALFRGERLSEMRATMDGRIDRLAISTGSVMKSGQVVAVIRLESASIEERNTNESNIIRTEGLIAQANAQIAALQQQRRTQEELVRDGLKAASVLPPIDSQIFQARSQVASLQKEVAMLRGRLQSTAELRAQESGTVTEVLKATGGQVRAGEPLFRFEPSTEAAEGAPRQQYCGGGIHTILYVSAQLAGKVKPGQEARVSPTDVKKEEYGYMLGKVEWVAPFAASTEDMREKLKNDQLVQSFGRQGPVFEARICLQADPANKANGFRWSSSTGPVKSIESGAPCSASLVVDQRRPYTYVIPTIRRMVGL